MIGTDDDPRRACALHQPMGAVLADVVEGAQDPILSAHAEQALTRDLEREIVTGIAHQALVPGELPGAGEQAPALLLEDGRIGVVARLQRIDGRRRVPVAHVPRSFSLRQRPGTWRRPG